MKKQLIHKTKWHRLLFVTCYVAVYIFTVPVWIEFNFLFGIETQTCICGVLQFSSFANLYLPVSGLCFDENLCALENIWNLKSISLIEKSKMRLLEYIDILIADSILYFTKKLMNPIKMRIEFSSNNFSFYDIFLSLQYPSAQFIFIIKSIRLLFHRK